LSVLLVFCTADHGGLADYAHAQAEALAARGHRVLLLAPAGFPFQSGLYKRRNLPNLNVKASHLRWLQRLGTAATILSQQIALSQAIAASGTRRVLFTSYSEYLAPLWAWRLRHWMRRGVRFAAVVHDPVRDFVVGPRWWHRLSIAQGYSFLSVALLHAPIQLETGSPQLALSTRLIPHGPYRYPPPQATAQELRQMLSIPADATLLLSFGHLRNNKNLQLILKAMVQLPQVWLLIAGPEATAGQQPSSHYRQLANKLGVAKRCSWQIGYQSPEQVAEHFTAADAVLLTYSAKFRSASGVMHVAAHYRKPVIASAGASALLDAVHDFNLGVVVLPDNSAALLHGIRCYLNEPPAPDWQGYEQANSWDRNAQLVAQSLGLESEPQITSP
jgi:glycosyltransferase involved in cell wall biosynthesis